MSLQEQIEDAFPPKYAERALKLILMEYHGLVQKRGIGPGIGGPRLLGGRYD